VKFRPYFARRPANCNLYAYGANNPVHYKEYNRLFKELPKEEQKRIKAECRKREQLSKK